MILFVILLVSFLFTFILNRIYKKYWDKDLNVSIIFSPVKVIEGNTGVLKEVITNKKPLPLSNLCVKFTTSKNIKFSDNTNAITTDNYYRNDVFSINANAKITRNLEFKAEKRGYYNIKSVDIISSNIFFSEQYVNNINVNSYIFVYPRKINYKEIPFPIDKLIGDYVSNKSLYDDPFDFKGIREYQPYDNISNINWKSSAKSNTLMVNEHNSTSSLKVEIILNNDLPNFQSDTLGEFGIKIAATLSEKICKIGIPVSFTCNSYDPFTNELIKINSQTGNTQINKINESLTKINLYNNNYDFVKLLKEQEKTNSFKIIISSDYRHEILNEFNNIYSKRKNTLLIIPCYSKPKSNFPNKNVFTWEVK